MQTMVTDSETLEVLGYDGILRDVRAFCEVVHFGTITVAARRLSESKGAISRRLARLEAGLGVRLLHRAPRSVNPTSEGLEFHRRASAALVALDEAADTVRGLTAVPRGMLRITAPIDLAFEILPPVLVGFHQDYPQIQVEIITTDDLLDLAAHRIDMALRISKAPPDLPLIAMELSSAGIGCYASPDWVKGASLPLDLNDLPAEHLILCDKAVAAAGSGLMTIGGQRIRLPANPAFRVSDFGTALRLASAGAGIALLPDPITVHEVAAGRLIHLLPKWPSAGVKLYALTLPGRDEPIRLKLFRTHLKQALDKLAQPHPHPNEA